ncbi:MAG: hypothetical protein LKI53_09630 [Bacteroidales bacterium]|nr:hypothetical protein [Bacteroidales bacterium]
METKSIYRILPVFLFVVLLGACSNNDKAKPLDFYSEAYEVPLHGERYIGVKSGSGEYSLHVENPDLFSAAEDKGWSDPAGVFLLKGLMTGKSALYVTDKKTGETANLAIKVVDNYEVFRIFDIYYNGSEIVENRHPVLSKIPYIFLVNDKARDLYFADQSGENSLTSNGIKIKGKGNYSFAHEDGKTYLILTYAADEDGKLTDDASVVATSHKFEFTQISDFLLHRLDVNLNLGMGTVGKTYPDNSRGNAFSMEEVNTIYKFDGNLGQVEIPTGVLN